MTDLMPLYKTMKKATFSDSEDEVCVCTSTCFYTAVCLKIVLTMLAFHSKLVADIDNIISHPAKILFFISIKKACFHYY